MLQVLVNLMENARKHAEGVTEIVLRAEGELDFASGTVARVVIRVSNDGAGIPEKHLPHVFEPFYTGGRGTGLGLAIVRRVVSGHGGAVEVESSGDAGTTFRIVLPSGPSR